VCVSEIMPAGKPMPRFECLLLYEMNAAELRGRGDALMLSFQKNAPGLAPYILASISRKRERDA